MDLFRLRGPLRLSAAALGIFSAACSLVPSEPTAPAAPLAPLVSPIPIGLHPGVKASDGDLIVGLRPGHDVSELPFLGGRAPQVLGELAFSMPVVMLKLPSGVSVDSALVAYTGQPAIALLARNQTSASLPRPAFVSQPWATPAPAPVIALGPNDPMLGQQWAFDDAVTRARAFWSRGVHAGSVTVAVVDTGIDFHHPDLAGRVLAGYNFKDGNTDTMDRDGHGTHVAGIIGASGNNGVGIAGVLWDVRLLAVKVMDGVSGSDFGAIAGIKYAVDAGAQVVNLSFSAPDGARNPLFDLAVQYATSKGAVVVAAAGNQGAAVSAPGNCPGAMAVAATSYSGIETRAKFSNFGPDVFVSAPGDRILSCWPGGGYRTMSGTSMAAPFVAGAVAAVLAAHPRYTQAQIRGAIVGAVDSLGASGRNDAYGYGRIDFSKLP